jgi:hypothetical protein
LAIDRLDSGLLNSRNDQRNNTILVIGGTGKSGKRIAGPRDP